jgi:hypothetical protein
MVRHGLQHHLNALHVMARLVRLGLPRPRALGLARRWERVIHPVLYPGRRPLIPVCVTAPVRLVSVPDILHQSVRALEADGLHPAVA